MNKSIESGFDIENHDASMDISFRPTESQYSFVLLAHLAACLRELVFDMARLAILAIMPPVMPKRQHFV